MKLEPSEGLGSLKSLKWKYKSVIPFLLLLATVAEVDGVGNGSSISMPSAKYYRSTA